MTALLVSGAVAQAADEPKDNNGGVSSKDADRLIVDQRVREMTNRLKLTDDQKGKVKALLEAEVKEMVVVREDQSLGVTDRATKMRAVRTATNEKIKLLLTPEQLETWDRTRPQKRRQPAAGAATPPTPPAAAAPTQ